MRSEIACALDAALRLASDNQRCFPCFTDKRPATSHGFKDAANDCDKVRQLWARCPAPLVGVVTGEISDIDVLDIDAPRHAEAATWFAALRKWLPATRIHCTRSGGFHLVFRHQPGLGSWAGRPIPGIDGRADGGYIIWWPAAGLPVLSDAPPAPWPAWLLEELSAPRFAAPGEVWGPAADAPHHCVRSSYAGAALRRAAERLAQASIGARNRTLNQEAYGIGRLITAGFLDAQEVADALAAAAFTAGLGPREIEATLRSAFRARRLL
jgi:Bifunctional DNA primase/polymerase, N-terminal